MNLKDLTNIQIDDFLFSKSRYFEGVFSCNSIPKNIGKKETFFIICNLARKNKKGTHFITIISHKNEILYIDSFGLPCENLDIKTFLVKTKKNIYFNTKTIQDPLSNFCGYFCILFVLFFENILLNKSIIKLTFYPSNLLYKNDNLCLQYIKKIIMK